MYGPFLQEMPDTVEKDKIWEWTRKIDLKVDFCSSRTGTENELS